MHRTAPCAQGLSKCAGRSCHTHSCATWRDSSGSAYTPPHTSQRRDLGPGSPHCTRRGGSACPGGGGGGVQSSCGVWSREHRVRCSLCAGLGVNRLLFPTESIPALACEQRPRGGGEQPSLSTERGTLQAAPAGFWGCHRQLRAWTLQTVGIWGAAYCLFRGTCWYFGASSHI